MIRAVVLDTGPLSMVTHRGGIKEIDACKRWLASLLALRVRVVVPEIADYELRRELLRARKERGIARLDALEAVVDVAELELVLDELERVVTDPGLDSGRLQLSHLPFRPGD